MNLLQTTAAPSTYSAVLSVGWIVQKYRSRINIVAGMLPLKRQFSQIQKCIIVLLHVMLFIHPDCFD